MKAFELELAGQGRDFQREVRKAFCVGDLAGKEQTRFWVQVSEWTEQPCDH